MFDFISKLFNGRRTISAAAKSLEKIFESDDVTISFFDLVYSQFQQYDESNNAQRNNDFAADIEFIIQFTTTSLTSHKHTKLIPYRVDAYFYICRRILQYIIMANESKDQLKDLQKQFYKQLGSAFGATKGCQPRLYLNNKEMLSIIDIPKHLVAFYEIKDFETLDIFFALCKLSFQSLLMSGEHGRLQWSEIFSKIQECKVEFTDIMSKYIECKEAFEPNPLGTPDLIYLIRKFQPFKMQRMSSPFEYLVDIISQLKLDYKAFFEQFHPCFKEGLASKTYTTLQVAPLLQMLGAHDERLFEIYLSVYASSVYLEDMWGIFICISRTGNINDAMQKHFSVILSQRFQALQIEHFKIYHSRSHESFKQAAIENLPHCRRTFEQMFHALLKKQLMDDQYYYRITEEHLRVLLDIASDVKTNSQFDSCYMLIFRHLFIMDKNESSKLRRIRNLFERLNRLDLRLFEENNMNDVIQDDWLTGYTFHNVQEWIKIEHYEYRPLCDAHRNSRWCFQIWSKIVHLSFSRFDTEKTCETLVLLNRWIANITPDVFNTNDILKVIVVKHIFEIIILKHGKPFVLLSNIDELLKYIQSVKQSTEYMDAKSIDDFIDDTKQSIIDILLLKSPRSIYLHLPKQSIASQFFVDIDFKEILSSQEAHYYRFPNINEQIESIMSMKKPNDININDADVKHEYFYKFINQVKTWLEWFDRFIDIFQNIIEWLHSRKLDGSDKLLDEIIAIRKDSGTNVLQIKLLIEKIVKLLNSFKNLERLCDLLNCAKSFVVTDPASLSDRSQFQSYLTDLKRLHPHNTFTCPGKKIEVKMFAIDDHRSVHWSIASIQHPCNIKVEYRVNDLADDQSSEVLFNEKDVHIEHQYLQGKFQTQRGGYLIITIDNLNPHTQRHIWYQLSQTNLSTCHIFHGILNMYYKKYFQPSHQPIREKDLSSLIQNVFTFIDKLLDGETTLDEMNDLKEVFHDKNINVRDEVQKLSTNRSIEKHSMMTDEQISQVYEWLRTYQVYSHLNNIILCVRTFNLISNTNDSIDNLEDVTIEENCSLKNMSQTYQELYQRFQKLNNHHLQLIKMINQSPNVIQMFKTSDLHSLNGLRRFQELRDNLTTQFQLQERNNLLLNSWIISYALCKPFVNQVDSLEQFITNLSQLPTIDETSLQHIRVVNDNIQIVTMWLSAEEITRLDNALITMEHIYKTGQVHIHLQRLINEQSSIEITCSTAKTSNESIDDEEEEQNKFLFTLSSSDIDDHKRQLTFCNVDLQTEMIYKKILLNEQLKLFKLIEKIFSILLKLEMAGHPNYQLRKLDYDIFDTQGNIRKILSDIGSNSNNFEQELEEIVQNQTKDFELIYRNLETTYTIWIKDLEKYRHENRLLTLFSNRQIMILIILLTVPSTNRSIQQRFLTKLFSLEKQQSNSTIICLIHYLQSLRLNDCDLSIDHITVLCQRYPIEQGSSTDDCLKRLSQFLKEIFNSGKELLTKYAQNNENQQYLVLLNSSSDRSSDLIENEINMDVCCMLISIFNDRLPADYQILWCSIATEDDIRLFFSRVRTFSYLTFAVLEIDKMTHRFREILFNEQDTLSKRSEAHGPIYYFSKEINLTRKGLRQIFITPKQRSPMNLRHLLQQNHDINIVYGEAGIGKTHYIKTSCKDETTSCISINDKINVSSLISLLISYESKTPSNQLSIYFNISIHAPFEQLNRLLFSLLICGSLNDLNSGLTFSSLITKRWHYTIEIPYTNKSNISIRENFDRILPILSIISSNTLHEVTDKNYQLYIDDEEELVARFLKAYENGTINTCMQPARRHFETEQPVEFDPLTNRDECRECIYRCMEIYAPDLPRNKIFELSFTKFLYRRIRFFTGFYYKYNMTDPYLGSTAMQQMIDEARYLTRINFSEMNYPRVYLVYDPEFSLYLLHNNWGKVPDTVKTLFNNQNPSARSEFQDKDYFVSCLAWLIDIKYDVFIDIMNKHKFILTENFVYKLFHVHERKLTKLALIIEGETGVGKTFLLNFYSFLLNANITYGTLDNLLIPRIVERTSLWLWKKIIDKILRETVGLQAKCLRQIERQLNADEELADDDDDDDNNNSDDEDTPAENPRVNNELWRRVKSSLKSGEFSSIVLRRIWKIILTTSNRVSRSTTMKLCGVLHEFVILQLTNSPLTDASPRLSKLLELEVIPTVNMAIEVFDEFIENTKIKPLFYRLLIHPGVTEEQIKEFMTPICQLARQIPSLEFVVFFDEVNTSSCLGLFKEMFMDGTLHGEILPKNIFFTAAINPSSIENNDDLQVHRRDYLVHKLPESLENLKVSYGALDRPTLQLYVRRKIASFTVTSVRDPKTQRPLEDYVKNTLADAIIAAQVFCEDRLGRNSVSQREIQRCFNLIDFFWRMRYDETESDPHPIRCIALALALIYYFRLPTKEDNAQRNDTTTPSREDLAAVLSPLIPEFAEKIQHELEQFVNSNNFVIPHGVAINQAIREHIFSIVISIVTRTPLCIIGAPGQSKTLSFQIVVQNLQGAQLSTTAFCKQLPAIDPFFCLGSKYSRSEDIAYVFDRAIRREQNYRENRVDTRCVVFLDEASLPDEKKMVLKVLHPYLDECKVAFVAVANKSFDAANANRMICVYRSLPSKDDQKILAYGCLGLSFENERTSLDKIISGLCQGYRKVLESQNIPQIFHDRDFIYMLRELRFELPKKSNDEHEMTIDTIKPMSLLRALEDNFNGIQQNEFEELVQIFFSSVREKCPTFTFPNEKKHNVIYRDVPTILRESMKLDSKRRRLYGRYKLIIDESEDESAINLLLQTEILDSDSSRIKVFRMSDFADDINNELRNVEILSNIKLCMETGKTIVMVNTSRIHGSLYDVFNQNFSIMATGDVRKIFSKVAIGPKTIDVVVHEDFQCIIHIKRSEFKDIPAPFLSRFQKYSLSINDFYRIQLQNLSHDRKTIFNTVEQKARTFIQHFGQEYFYGFNESTLDSYLLSILDKTIQQCYTQLNIKLKSFIEQNPNDVQQCLLRMILSKLIQLVSPESIILKLRTFEDSVAQWLCELYFQQQEHFSIENFIGNLMFNSNDDEIRRTTKVMIFTRTSSYILGLNQRSVSEVFTEHSRQMDILNLGTIENSVELQERFDSYKNDANKNILLIIIDGRIGQQRLHIPFVRQLIDATESICKKHFLMLVHSPAQDLYHQSSFSSIFLHDWDFHFFDTCTSASAFHLQKFLRILSSSHDDSHQTQVDHILCDLNILFEDCLWDFCSRIQIFLPDLSDDMFADRLAFEFYQRRTNIFRRVECLKQILRQAKQLQTHIVDIYHQHLSAKKNSSEKIYKLIYEISKEILCGKRFNGLIDSIQSQTRNSFTNFVSNILKFIINDYGLDTLTKLSTDYGSLLNLIDYQSFATTDDQDVFSNSPTQSIFQLVSHYSCIPQTPLYHLFHQRVKAHANEIQQANQHSFEEFRSKLATSLLNDKILIDIIDHSIVQSYSNDLVRTVCTITENDFHANRLQRQQTIESISHWLLLVDEQDHQSLDDFPNKSIWLLSHVYGSIEYEQNDLISMYSACRILDRLDTNSDFYHDLFNEQNTTRANVRERLFRLIFDYLWNSLLKICSDNQSSQTWISTYTFISKYFPSDKVLQRSELIDLKNQIDFMHLAYLIFLNEKTIEPHRLISNLIQRTRFTKTSNCLKLLPTIIEIIHDINIDIQQWIVSILKTTIKEINFLFKYLNQPTCQLTLGMRQFLFDELVHLYLKFKQPNQDKFDVWDRFNLIPILLECIDTQDNYQIPYHPSIIVQNENISTRIVLLDLYFFHLQRQLTNETMTYNLLNKGMLLTLPKIEQRQLISFGENLFKQLKDYFRVKILGLLVCETNLKHEDKQQVYTRSLPSMITDLLIIDQQSGNLSNYLQLFLSTVILKQSWYYLLNFLSSDQLQQVNPQWANVLFESLKLTHRQNQNHHLQLYHQIDFTLSTDNQSSIFPNLHQSYEELRVIIETCVQNSRTIDQWRTFQEWIQLKLISDSLIEIKVMLLLIIYYNYYCNNQLSSIQSLLPIIETSLTLSVEELQIFRAFINPEQFLIGHTLRNNNLLNKMFQLDCHDEFELNIRHMLVNLLAMIMLGGKQSFLWTFAFQTTNLPHTFGFGSTAHSAIQSNGVHYDCGCILSQNGDLVRFVNTVNMSTLNVPAVYVVYFSTFGALAWHLLLFDSAVNSLHGPILTPGIIAGIQPGDDIRAKTCHFVCTRLLSTYHFLSIRSNQTDTCILLTRCFEQMAYLTQKQESWIKPVFSTFNEQVKAEQEFQDKVFYFVHGKFVEYKTFVNQLSLQTQIQKNLQDFIDQTPIIIQFTHFKTELHRPIHIQSSLKILRHILNSFDFFKLTRFIYDLSQFYRLLHQTYSQLIERNEFTKITLKELFDRYQKQSRNENETHENIIEKGIQAVNDYHRFADGLIRPGACDETQRFSTISFDTPVSYLVTTENHDEGDIIMRILSVLIDFHNDTLDILDKELDHQSNNQLKTLVNELTSKEISILKIANDNTGVITLTDKDCLWIEQLSQASLINNNQQYFLTVNSEFTFDFTYVQSQIIRTYLLLCRINYKHVIQKYQCFTKRTPITTNEESFDLDERYSISLDREQLENQMMNLKDMLLDRLYQVYSFLRQIALTLKNHPDDVSNLYLLEFAKQTDNELYQRFEQYQIEDFQLCHINHILKLYTESMSGFHYLFTNISPLLQVPIQPELDAQLAENLNEDIQHIEQIQSQIQMITKLLDELKTIEDPLLQQSNKSLSEICRHLAIENAILDRIPNGIKCENYVSVCIHLIQRRSILQERKVNINEKEIKLWNENIHSIEQHNQQQINRFDQYLMNPQDEEQNEFVNSNETWTLPSLNIEEPTMIEYSALMEFRMKLVTYSSSIFFQQIQEYREELIPESIPLNKAQKFTIVQLDGKINSYLWKTEKLFEQLKKLCVSDQIAIVDKDEIFVDVTANDTCQAQLLTKEYHVIDKQSLFPIHFRFRSQKFEYLVTSKCNISTVIHRFIDDNQLKSSKSDTILCFLDPNGKCINENEIITDISVTEENPDENILCEIRLKYNEDGHQTHLFSALTEWKQMNIWLKKLPVDIQCAINGYAFIRKGQNAIIDDNQTISNVFDQNQSIIVDVINRGSVAKVIFSYETNTVTVSALKSMKICSLLADENLLEQLNCSNVYPDNCVLLTGEKYEQILTKEDLKQSVGTYTITGERSVRFQISLFVEIIKFDDGEQIKVPVSNRNISFGDLLARTGKSMDIYKYLAENETKRVLDSNETLTDLNQTQFLLLKEDQTCSITIVQSDEEKHQRYAVFATIGNISEQYLLYENDFVPSSNTQLVSFQSKSPLRFTLTNENLPVTVTLKNKQTDKTITFNCSYSMTAKRLSNIANQFFHFEEDLCQLMQDDSTLIDDADISLEDIDDSMTNFQFFVISTVSLECKVTFSEQTVILSCQRDTLASTIIRETLEKLHFPFDRLDDYELIVLCDDPTGIGLETSIDDICQLFPSTVTTIPFQLKSVDS